MILNTAHCVDHCWHKIHWTTCHAPHDNVSLIAFVSCAKIQAHLSDNCGQYINRSTSNLNLWYCFNWPFQLALLFRCPNVPTLEMPVHSFFCFFLSCGIRGEKIPRWRILRFEHCLGLPLSFCSWLLCRCTFKNKEQRREGWGGTGENCSGRVREWGREEVAVMFSCVFVLWEVAQPQCIINTHMDQHLYAHTRAHIHTPKPAHSSVHGWGSLSPHGQGKKWDGHVSSHSAGTEKDGDNMERDGDVETGRGTVV